MNVILNCIAGYSAEAALNPGETCEFPEDMKRVDVADNFGLLAVIEVFRSEMNTLELEDGRKVRLIGVDLPDTLAPGKAVPRMVRKLPNSSRAT